MLNDLTMMARASAMARHATERHAQIAQNIANADTPGYRAKELAPFEAMLADKARQGDRAANRRLYQAREIEGLDISPNGNSVSIEDQMTRAVDAQAQHQAALTIYRKALDLLRLSVQNRI